MTPIVDRLRAALSVSYEVERELASGGMGTIFLARDIALDRKVAVKILRPELATAVAAERFLREARILASLSHPNVLPVHHAGEAGGFFYYVMDHVEGETLQQRLARGPMPVEEVIKLGSDLLAALEAVHGHGIIHRDVKPSNVFLVGDRAVLADFGIAKRVRQSSPGLTSPGHKIGTPEYMPPEQVTGEVTERTDLYALGMVLFEAITGRKWSILKGTGEVDWSGVPRRVSHVLLRALEWSPKDRWPDARSFRNALVERRAAPSLRFRVAMALMILGVIAGVVLAVLIIWPSPPQREITLLPFDIEPCPCAVATLRPRGEASRDFADQVSEAVALALSDGESAAGGNVRAGDDSQPPPMMIGGEVAVADGRVWIRARTLPGAARPLSAEKEGPRAAWRAVADSLAYQLLRQIWKANPEAQWLPPRTLPQTTKGLVAWLRAESLYWRAHWGSAYEAYRNAEDLDATCWLCSFRITRVAHWVRITPDPTSEARVRAHLESFPPEYQSVVRALLLPESERLAALRRATDSHPLFYYGWFERGDEVLHRGPLTGDRRNEAEGLFERAIRHRNDFAPAWEHLAWVRITEGNAPGATEALDTLEAIAPVADITNVWTLGLRLLLQLSFAWRFLPQEQAIQHTDAILANPLILTYPELVAGPRYLVHFDAPQGAIWVWDRLTELPGAETLDPSGLLARVFGHVAQGQLRLAKAAAAELQLAMPDLGFFAAELEAALAFAAFAFLDTDSAEFAGLWPSLRTKLTRYVKPGADLEIRRRAAWMLTLLAQRTGAESEAAAYRDLFEDEPGRTLKTLLDATRAASAGRSAQALEIAKELQAYEGAWEAPDPFFRSLLHLFRAKWHLRQNELQGALQELRWHENDDVKNSPVGEPQPAEVDWAFGTLARWQRARLLDRLEERGPEMCNAYLAVARLWADGDARYAARADSAAQRADTLGCSS